MNLSDARLDYFVVYLVVQDYQVSYYVLKIGVLVQGCGSFSQPAPYLDDGEEGANFGEGFIGKIVPRAYQKLVESPVAEIYEVYPRPAIR